MRIFDSLPTFLWSSQPKRRPYHPKTDIGLGRNDLLDREVMDKILGNKPTPTQLPERRPLATRLPLRPQTDAPGITVNTPVDNRPGIGLRLSDDSLSGRTHGIGIGTIASGRIRPPVPVAPAVPPPLQEITILPDPPLTVELPIPADAPQLPIDTPPLPGETSPVNKPVEEAAKKVFGDPPAPPETTSLVSHAISAAKSLPKGFFTIVPYFFYLLYTSTEKHLQNLVVNIEAPSLPKTYTVSLGKKGSDEVGISLQIEAGKPILVLNEGHPEGTESSFPSSFFKPRLILDSSEGVSHLPYLGPLARLANPWKPQEPHTECIIIVDDPGNPSLKDGEQIISVPLSKLEGFSIVHRDPTLASASGTKQADGVDSQLDTGSSEWTTLSSATVTVHEPLSEAEEHLTQEYPIPFEDGFGKKTGFFLKVKQTPWFSEKSDEMLF